MRILSSKILFLFFVFFVSLIFSSQVYAAKEGHFTLEFAKLEKQVQKKYGPEVLAQRLSEVTTFEKTWPMDLSDDIKLYVAIRWLEQRFFAQSNKVFRGIDTHHVSEELWTYYFATLLVQQNQPRVAAPYIISLSEKYPEDFDVLFLKSMLLTALNNIPSAIDDLSYIIKKSRRHGKARFQRALLYLVSLNYDMAEKDLLAATKFLPKSETEARQTAFLQLALIQLKIHMNDDKAQKYIQDGIKVAPDSQILKEFYTKIGKGEVN